MNILDNEYESALINDQGQIPTGFVETQELDACVGIMTCPFQVFVFTSQCPVLEEYCIDYNSATDGPVVKPCPYFREVETIDYQARIICECP